MINLRLWSFAILFFCVILQIFTSSMLAQSKGLDWREADKVDRMELSDLLEDHVARIHGLGKYMCRYTIDATTDIGKKGVRIDAYSNLVAENGKGSIRCISRCEDVGRQIGTFNPPGRENDSMFFSIDLLKSNGKSYRWGGDHKFELVNTTIDSQRKSSLLIQPMIVPLSGGGLQKCTALESSSFESDFSPKLLSFVCEEDDSKIFRFDAKNKDEIAKQGLAAYAVLSWKNELPISFKLFYGKINSPKVVNQIDTTWKKVGQHDVPERIVQEASQGKSLLTIDCKWDFDDKVPSELFDEKDLGSRDSIIDEMSAKRPTNSK